MKVIGVYRKCDLVTMTGTTFALIGILCTLNNKPTFAIFSLIISAICDAFDGIVARRFRSLKDYEVYGIELDSLNDIIAFGVLPMLIVLNIVEHNIYTYIIGIFFVLCGLIRLAYFNMLANTKRSNGKTFIGLPITASAIILPLIYFILAYFNMKYANIIFPGTLLITGLLYILPFKLKKLTGREKAILSIIGIISIIFIIIKYYI